LCTRGMCRHEVRNIPRRVPRRSVAGAHAGPRGPVTRTNVQRWELLNFLPPKNLDGHQDIT
jgi:hypothetical protein